MKVNSSSAAVSTVAEDTTLPDELLAAQLSSLEQEATLNAIQSNIKRLISEIASEAKKRGISKNFAKLISLQSELNSSKVMLVEGMAEYRAIQDYIASFTS
ncbi:MAG: hypothetical protein GWP59_06690 [Chlamydiales bacterium]|nr:hypothetical protein [Chlamydiales bacterium]